MFKKYRIECEAIGGKMDGHIANIGAKFVLRKRTTYEARKYMLAAAKELFEALNKNEKLRLFLSEFPFPSNRLKIRIRFAKQNYYSYYDDSLESVTLEDNEIAYYNVQPPVFEGVYLRPEIFAKESYQKAVERTSL